MSSFAVVSKSGAILRLKLSLNQQWKWNCCKPTQWHLAPNIFFNKFRSKASTFNIWCLDFLPGWQCRHCLFSIWCLRNLTASSWLWAGGLLVRFPNPHYVDFQVSWRIWLEASPPPWDGFAPLLEFPSDFCCYLGFSLYWAALIEVRGVLMLIVDGLYLITCTASTRTRLLCIPT